ncbi:MAG TPA: 4Fe-4S dicluster domain-containing protein, partial [Gemmatimonadaceae bacterium]
MSDTLVTPGSQLSSSPLAGTPLDHARAGLDACVHCGFCMQACPTYLALDDENDSPRGRLLLMRSMLDGALSPDDEAARGHLDACLGCRACETVCPSGVPYGHLLEATRATLTKRNPLPLMARLMLAVFARPVLMRLAMRFAYVLRSSRLSALLAAVMPGRLGASLRMLEATRPALSTRSYSAKGTGELGTVAI